MKSTYDSAMTRGVFPHEGGYTNEDADPGGPTNWGITIADARAYWKSSATAADVRSMPKQIAEDIYSRHYAAPVRYNDLPAGVDYSVLDYAINSGVGRAGKVLRRLVNLPDNVSTVTDEVIAAVKKRDPVLLIGAINSERLKFLKGLKNWPTYANGWTRRVNEVRQLSMDLANNRTTVALPTGVANGKGKVADPKGTKKVITAASGVGSAGLVAWTYKHPGLAVFILVATGASVLALIALINRRRDQKQDAATPGITPVPEAA